MQVNIASVIWTVTAVDLLGQDYAVKKYKGHRITPRENLELCSKPSKFKKKQDDKLTSTFKSC